MAPIFVRDKWKWLDFPMDLGRKWRGQPVLGPHKTVRGFVAGIVLAIIVAFLQKQLYEADLLRSWALINYEAQWLNLGFWMGLGGVVGDSVKSLVKRRLSVKSGGRFMPWDQIDWILGMLVFTSIFVTSLPWQIWIWCFIIGFAGHILIRHIAYWLKINREKW